MTDRQIHLSRYVLQHKHTLMSHHKHLTVGSQAADTVWPRDIILCIDVDVEDTSNTEDTPPSLVHAVYTRSELVAKMRAGLRQTNNYNTVVLHALRTHLANYFGVLAVCTGSKEYVFMRLPIPSNNFVPLPGTYLILSEALEDVEW